MRGINKKKGKGDFTEKGMKKGKREKKLLS